MFYFAYLKHNNQKQINKKGNKQTHKLNYALQSVHKQKNITNHQKGNDRAHFNLSCD